MSLVCNSSSSFTASAICFVLITVSSNCSSPSSCSDQTQNSTFIRMHQVSKLIGSIQIILSSLPFMICLWRLTMPWLSNPATLVMASTGLVFGPSKLSLLAKFDMFKVLAIWLVFVLKFDSMSLRRFNSFSDLQFQRRTHSMRKYIKYPMKKKKPQR